MLDQLKEYLIRTIVAGANTLYVNNVPPELRNYAHVARLGLNDLIKFYDAITENTTKVLGSLGAEQKKDNSETPRR